MSITGPGSITALNIQAINNMNNQLNTLTTQLSTNQVAQTYSDLGAQAGVALSLNSQLASITAYGNTATTLNTTLGVAQSALTQLGTSSSAVEQALNQQGAFNLNSNGQTTAQATASAQLDQILAVLNTQVGSNYIFSGSSPTQASVASTSDILNGNGAEAGFTTVMAQRLQADQGANGLGRLDIPAPSGAVVSVSEDAANSPFGFKLKSVSSSLTGATVTGPSGSPSSISVDLSTATVNSGDSISFDLTLPDGSTQSVSLTATSSSPPGANQFTIGATPADTATNLQTALTTAVGNLDQTAMPAASAMAAANDFFSSDPPQRVDPGSPADYATATSQVNGTTADTVFWYTGEDGSTPARQTATAQVGPSITVSYGMRANEQAISTLVGNVAVMAATTYSASDPNASANYQALTADVVANLDGKSGTQQVSDIEADLANVQTTVSNATTLNTQTQSTLQDMVQNIDGVNQTQIGEQLMNLQNSLSATLETTARMAQMSLVNFLSPSAG
jgi:flagellin-like hook-associated protein FlgL